MNDEYEEYAIHDYELPFEIDEYTPIEEVNRLCEMVEDLPNIFRRNYQSCNPTLAVSKELCEHEDDIICHSGCDDMADVALPTIWKKADSLANFRHIKTISTMQPMGVTWNGGNLYCHEPRRI